MLPDRLTLMQRVQDAARHGYHYFISGQTSPEKWPDLSRKFAKLYSTDLKKSTRSNWRKRGDAVSFCYGYPSPPHESPRVVRWVLLSTEGVHVNCMPLYLEPVVLQLLGQGMILQEWVCRR